MENSFIFWLLPFFDPCHLRYSSQYPLPPSHLVPEAGVFLWSAQPTGHSHSSVHHPSSDPPCSSFQSKALSRPLNSQTKVPLSTWQGHCTLPTSSQFCSWGCQAGTGTHPHPSIHPPTVHEKRLVLISQEDSRLSTSATKHRSSSHNLQKNDSHPATRKSLNPQTLALTRSRVALPSVQDSSFFFLSLFFFRRPPPSIRILAQRRPSPSSCLSLLSPRQHNSPPYFISLLCLCVLALCTSPLHFFDNLLYFFGANFPVVAYPRRKS